MHFGGGALKISRRVARGGAGGRDLLRFSDVNSEIPAFDNRLEQPAVKKKGGKLPSLAGAPTATPLHDNQSRKTHHVGQRHSGIR